MNSIDKDFPTPEEFKSLELRTLCFIKNDPYFSTNCPELVSDADKAYNFIKYSVKSPTTLIRFDTSISITFQSTNLIIYLEAKVDIRQNPVKYTHFTYCMTICENNTEVVPKVIRKYHFDYDLDKINSPKFHLQYCGELTPRLRAAGCNIDHFDPGFSEPRIPTTPVSLALILNFVMKEFCSAESARNFLEDDRWRRIVYDNEKVILEPYYRQCSEFFNSKVKGVRLLSDFYYGIQ